jgi:hypothetical protein
MRVPGPGRGTRSHSRCALRTAGPPFWLWLFHSSACASAAPTPAARQHLFSQPVFAESRCSPSVTRRCRALGRSPSRCVPNRSPSRDLHSPGQRRSVAWAPPMACGGPSSPRIISTQGAERQAHHRAVSPHLRRSVRAAPDTPGVPFSPAFRRQVQNDRCDLKVRVANFLTQPWVVSPGRHLSQGIGRRYALASASAYSFQRLPLCDLIHRSSISGRDFATR